MVLVRILILTILQFTCVNLETVQHDFKVSKDHGVDILGSETCLISNVYKSSRMTCMGSCNSNPECLTVVFDRNKGLIRNCFFYNRYFNSSEFILSSTSIVYEKKLGEFYLKKINFFNFNFCNSKSFFYSIIECV
jgi:hypothetical protein